MSEQKLKAETITIVDLVREAITIPDGWHEEVHVEKNGEVTFTAPLTQNSWTGKTPNTPLDTYIGNLHGIDVDDFHWLHRRSDGLIEVELLDENDDYNGTKKIVGEYYPLAQIITLKDAVDIIIDQLGENNEYERLLNAIQEHEEKK